MGMPPPLRKFVFSPVSPPCAFIYDKPIGINPRRVVTIRKRQQKRSCCPSENMRCRYLLVIWLRLSPQTAPYSPLCAEIFSHPGTPYSCNADSTLPDTKLHLSQFSHNWHHFQALTFDFQKDVFCYNFALDADGLLSFLASIKTISLLPAKFSSFKMSSTFFSSASEKKRITFIARSVFEAALYIYTCLARFCFNFEFDANLNSTKVEFLFPYDTL